ncbi:MAG: PBP1A family penicillin-binding protein [Acidobacteriota bacterium]
MSDQLGAKNTRSKLPPRGWVKARRPVVYKAKPRSRFRRALRWIFNPWTVSLILLAALGAFLTLTYFWFEFSDKIDHRLLSGEVYTPSAGIYSAPKTLKNGEESSLSGMVDYLKSAGYIEKNNKADASRSQYSVAGEALEVVPGYTATIDGKRAFPKLLVKFHKDLKAVASVFDEDAGRDVPEARLEPKMLSTIAAEGDGRRKTVTFHDLPPHLIKAITVTEDRAFFEHYGVNLRGIARALWHRYEGEDNTPLSNQGGSSITQQLVKNLMLNNDPTLERKLTEAYMSIILETRLSKEEIFTLYANQIYLGQQSGVSIYGVGEAASVYFGKDVTQLTLPEAAMIAGIIRSPNRYNPFKNPDKIAERRNQVLDSMLEAGAISLEQFAEAHATPVQLKQLSNIKDLQGMPYFSQYAIEELPKLVSDPEALQHLRVYTSIDPDLQRIAYETVAKRLEGLDKNFPKKPKGELNAALVAIRPKTGEIVAMVGGRDYLQNQFNRATDAMRQPGSVFKPFVYTTAINSPYDSGSRIFTAASTFKDEKKVFTFNQDSYSPNNFGDTFSNKDMTLRDALVHSKNVITVDLGMQLNIGRVMNLATKAGMPRVEKAYPSMALGTAEATPLQVAGAYTMFANLGDRVAPRPITQITSGDGKVITTPSIDKKTIVRPDVAYIMDDIMKDVINRGTAAQARGWGFQNVAGKTAFAGKTGTSRDGWFAGFTPDLVCVVYVGFDNGDDLDMKGADSAMPIWADFMKEALARNPGWNGDWTMPADVHKAEIDTRDGTVLRELDSNQTIDTKAADPTKPKADSNKKTGLTVPADPNLPQTEETEDPLAKEKAVPPEFRRVELFVAGTIPLMSMKDENTELPPDEPLPTDSPEQQETPGPTPSDLPVNGTLGDNHDTVANKQAQRPRRAGEDAKMVIVAICPISGLRATAKCPQREARSFRAGTEPTEFCNIHQ